ncbi:hypothetical protein SprV_0401669800 [Sparganum proliferum]
MMSPSENPKRQTNKVLAPGIASSSSSESMKVLTTPRNHRHDLRRPLDAEVSGTAVQPLHNLREPDKSYGVATSVNRESEKTKLQGHHGDLSQTTANHLKDLDGPYPGPTDLEKGSEDRGSNLRAQPDDGCQSQNSRSQAPNASVHNATS